MFLHIRHFRIAFIVFLLPANSADRNPDDVTNRKHKKHITWLWSEWGKNNISRARKQEEDIRCYTYNMIHILLLHKWNILYDGMSINGTMGKMAPLGLASMAIKIACQQVAPQKLSIISTAITHEKKRENASSNRRRNNKWGKMREYFSQYSQQFSTTLPVLECFNFSWRNHQTGTVDKKILRSWNQRRNCCTLVARSQAQHLSKYEHTDIQCKYTQKPLRNSDKIRVRALGLK